MKPVDIVHPDDERLVARYFDPSGGDQELELHLVRCPACATRANRLSMALDADHDRTFGAADGWFGADRLVQQRTAILARIARPPSADVVAFPNRTLRARVASRVVRSSRWAAAAAVVVFSVSLGSGAWFVGEGTVRPADRFVEASLQAALAPMHEGEDALLLEIDRALTRPQTRELRALEALTPRADEVVEF